MVVLLEILRALDAVRGFTEQRASDEVSLPAEWTLLLCQDEDTCAQLAQYRMHSQKVVTTVSVLIMAVSLKVVTSLCHPCDCVT